MNQSELFEILKRIQSALEATRAVFARFTAGAD